MSAMTVARSRPLGNPWAASIYAGVLTAAAAYAASYFLQADQAIYFAVALLLTGAAPVLGYAFASGRVGPSIGGIIGGIIGAIPVIGIILWPLLVGAFMSTQSIGKLFVGSIIGLILGLAVFFGMATVMGQDPSWFTAGFVLLFAVWGGAAGAFMTAWASH